MTAQVSPAESRGSKAPPAPPALAADGKALRLSRTGKRPVELPKGVTVTVKDGKFEVKGAKATLTCAAVPNVDVKVDGGKVTVEPKIGGRDGARFQGLARALLGSMVVGVSTGYTKTLQLVGTGYRAELKGTTLNLALGLSHPVVFPLPAGVTAVIPAESKGTLLILSGADKGVMGQTAAKIRGFRPPSPYGGKGVRYQGENVRVKAGKAGGKGGK